MDLELTDEQNLLSEALTTLLEREWLPAEIAHFTSSSGKTEIFYYHHKCTGVNCSFRGILTVPRGFALAVQLREAVSRDQACAQVRLPQGRGRPS